MYNKSLSSRKKAISLSDSDNQNGALGSRKNKIQCSNSKSPASKVLIMKACTRRDVAKFSAFA